MKKYDPIIEMEPYTQAEWVAMEETSDGEYYSVKAVDALLQELGVDVEHTKDGTTWIRK